jgi:large subunit ribosomal protein L3
MRFMGTKKGMMQLFDDQGNKVVCTVISVENHVVSQVKTKEKEGYDALQLASLKVSPAKLKNVTKPQKGHFKKANVEPRRKLKETRIEKIDQYQLGQEISLDLCKEWSFVDVRGVSKGKGYQGVIKRHNFAGGPAAHGSGFHRHGGSCGMRSSPGRCLPGQKKAGHMGAEAVTVQNLRIVRVDSDKQVILVEGAIPGARGGLVYITKAKKR